MVWIVCQDSDNKVFYENSDTGEMTRQIPIELIEAAEEKQEKETYLLKKKALHRIS